MDNKKQDANQHSSDMLTTLMSCLHICWNDTENADDALFQNIWAWMSESEKFQGHMYAGNDNGSSKTQHQWAAGGVATGVI